MIRRGCQCVMLSLTSRMQRLCVESWTVGLLYRCWEQLLLTKETLRCGHKRFSVEEMSLRFTSVQHHHHMKTTVQMATMLDWCVQVGANFQIQITSFFCLFVFLPSVCEYFISFFRSLSRCLLIFYSLCSIYRPCKCEAGWW